MWKERERLSLSLPLQLQGTDGPRELPPRPIQASTHSGKGSANSSPRGCVKLTDMARNFPRKVHKMTRSSEGGAVVGYGSIRAAESKFESGQL